MNFKGIVLLSKAISFTIRLAEVQLVIDSCCLISQSNYLNNSNKDCDYFSVPYQRTEHVDATFSHLENTVWFENYSAKCSL